MATVFVVLGDLIDKHFLIIQFLQVCARKLGVIRQASALLAVILEVLHLLASLRERFFVRDEDASAAEGLGEISVDLGLGVEHEACLFLDQRGDL